jgi:hypothetical protein
VRERVYAEYEAECEGAVDAELDAEAQRGVEEDGRGGAPPAPSVPPNRNIRKRLAHTKTLCRCRDEGGQAAGVHQVLVRRVLLPRVPGLGLGRPQDVVHAEAEAQTSPEATGGLQGRGRAGAIGRA